MENISTTFEEFTKTTIVFLKLIPWLMPYMRENTSHFRQLLTCPFFSDSVRWRIELKEPG